MLNTWILVEVWKKLSVRSSLWSEFFKNSLTFLMWTTKRPKQFFHPSYNYYSLNFLRSKLSHFSSMWLALISVNSRPLLLALFSCTYLNLLGSRNKAEYSVWLASLVSQWQLFSWACFEFTVGHKTIYEIQMRLKLHGQEIVIFCLFNKPFQSCCSKKSSLISIFNVIPDCKKEICLDDFSRRLWFW